ncbi:MULTISPECIES: cell envelope integrity protein TolA [unclassified Halobacteriovorax]|uniref:cell envelope integrity protein TolA n=1 Tax=unclassified Halobacteriovorax TaxID=2639665 RepID=UPI00399AD727
MEEGKPLIFLEPLTEAVKKLKESIEASAEAEGIEIYEVESPEEYNQLIPTIGQSLTIACSPKKTAQCIQPLRKFIHKNNVKVLLINSKAVPPKTLEKFRKIGLTEYIQEPVPAKTLEYKVNLILRSLKKAEETAEMEFRSGEDKAALEERNYEDKKEAERNNNGGHLKGNVSKAAPQKANKDVFDDSTYADYSDDDEIKEQGMSLKDLSAHQKQNNQEGGHLKGSLEKNSKADNTPEINFEEDLFKSLEQQSSKSNKDLGGSLKGQVSPTLDDYDEDKDDFDEDLFKSLDSVKKSSQNTGQQSGQLKGSLSPTLDDIEDDDFEDDLFKSLDTVKKSANKADDLGGSLQGKLSPTLDDIEDEKDTDEDLFANLDKVKNATNKSNEKDGSLKGSISATLDNVENEKDTDEDLFASLDNIKKSNLNDSKTSRPNLSGKLTPTQSDTDYSDDDFDDDLLKTLEELQSNKTTSKGRDQQGIQSSSNDELIDNEKGLQGKSKDSADLAMSKNNGSRDNQTNNRDNEDLFASLDAHSKEKNKKYDNVHNLDLNLDNKAENEEVTRPPGPTIEYEKKGDLGEQTIDYSNLDKQPEYEGGSKEELEIKFSESQDVLAAKKREEANRLAEQLKIQQQQEDARKKQEEERKRALEAQQAKALADAEAERLKNEQEIEDALGAIFIPDPKDMNFFIEAMNFVIDGDAVKSFTNEYINTFCIGTVVIYNIQNECILGNEDVDDRFEAIKNVLKAKRKPSWNDTTFQSELLYYHIPIIENGKYHNFILFLTSKGEIARSNENPKRVEQCLQVIKGSYLSGEDRASKKIESKKSSSITESVSGLFKGIFGGKK